MSQSATWPSLHSCPYALRDTIYQDCPRVVHGFDGEPCDGCVAPPEPPVGASGELTNRGLSGGPA